MTWREENRKDRILAAQIQRENDAAAVQRRISERAAAARARRVDRNEQAAQRLATKQARRDQRAATRAKVRDWATANVVDLLIYPGILVAFVMSAPSMAAYGHGVYQSWLGALLPVISELLMFAFAVAVLVSRRRTPERPVWSLQVGVFVFATVSGGLNFLHGFADGWDAGVVMAVVAVSGITAHQLTLATPPRSRAERAEARITRRATRKLAQVRRTAIRQAVAEVDENGQAHLVHQPGRFTLTRHWRTGFRLTLTEETVPETPVAVPELGTGFAEEIAAWLAGQAGTGTGTHREGTAQTDYGSALNADGSQDHRVPELVDQIRAAIEAGALKPNPSRRAVQKFLNVRTEVAGRVVKALRDDGPSGVSVA